MIDCEGLFNINRSIEEEINLVLTSSSLSDITLLNTKHNLDDRNFIDFFNKLYKISDKLKGSKLFKGNLLILIRDIPDNKNDFENTMNSFDKGLLKILNERYNIEENIFETTQCRGLVHFENSNFFHDMEKIRSQIL